MKLKDYERIVGPEVIKKIEWEASSLLGKHIIHINSTYYGGGVAEMLTSLVPLMNDLGITTGWRIIKGNPDFFTITKKFHNALQGDTINLSDIKKEVYEQTNKRNSIFSHIQGHDAIIVHDPQPLPLITFYEKQQPWIWRCHIDLSGPNKELWEYLEQFIVQYDGFIVSKEEYRHKIKMPQHIIHPSIDPLSPKNIDLDDAKITEMLMKFGVPRDKPIVAQISRFDKWKDPLGVVEAFSSIKKQVDCRLVLLGSMATDDPEGQEIYEEVLYKTSDMDDVHVINFENHILVNALQRASSVVIQKSLREGFGLTVSEALWKETPVVASDVGGIPLQIKDGRTGYLVDSIDACAHQTIDLLKHPEKAKDMGKAGHEHVKKNFLITRHLMDYLLVLKRYLK